MDAKELGAFIAEIRKEKEMTQAELAEKLHVTKSAVSKWERGAGLPDVNTIEPLAVALEVSIVEIVKCRKMTSEEILHADAAEAMKEIIAQAEAERKASVRSWVTLVIFLVAAVLFTDFFGKDPDKLYGGAFSMLIFWVIGAVLPIIAIIIKKYVHLLSLGSFFCCAMVFISELTYNIHKVHIRDWSAVEDTAAGMFWYCKYIFMMIFTLNVYAFFFSDKENQKQLGQIFIDIKNAVYHAILWVMRKF